MFVIGRYLSPPRLLKLESWNLHMLLTLGQGWAQRKLYSPAPPGGDFIDVLRFLKKIDFLITGKRYQFKNWYTCFLYPDASYIERVLRSAEQNANIYGNQNLGIVFNVCDRPLSISS